MAEATHSESLTEEEAAVYDRQIRLWGVEAQNRLKKGRVLICGLSGLGNEVCKNLVLAGVHKITLVDPEDLTEQNAREQFLAARSCIGQKRARASQQMAQKMNPMVSLEVDTSSIDTKPREYFKDFDIVVLFGPVQDDIVKISQVCHDQGIKFMWGAVHGQYGYSISDYGEHVYFQEKTKVTTAAVADEGPPEAKRAKTSKGESDPEIEEKTMKFLPLTEAFNMNLCKDMNSRKLQSVPKAYFIMHVMLRYNKTFGSLPGHSDSTEEWDRLVEIRDQIMQELNVDEKYVSDDVLRSALGFFYPVCSVVGGIMSQEVIKALSGKDAPYDNAFLFDGDTSCGTVMKMADVQE